MKCIVSKRPPPPSFGGLFTLSLSLDFIFRQKNLAIAVILQLIAVTLRGFHLISAEEES